MLSIQYVKLNICLIIYFDFFLHIHISVLIRTKKLWHTMPKYYQDRKKQFSNCVSIVVVLWTYTHFRERLLIKCIRSSLSVTHPMEKKFTYAYLKCVLTFTLWQWYNNQEGKGSCPHPSFSIWYLDCRLYWG